MAKNVLITGGTRGIGAACSRIFQKNGYNVYAIYNKDEKYYNHALVTCGFEVSAESVGFYPTLPPRFVEDKNTAFSFDYNAAQKHNRFQTKIAPAGVTLIDINKE